MQTPLIKSSAVKVYMWHVLHWYNLHFTVLLLCFPAPCLLLFLPIIFRTKKKKSPVNTHAHRVLCQRDSQVQKERKYDREHVKLNLDPLEHFYEFFRVISSAFPQALLGAGPVEWPLFWVYQSPTMFCSPFMYCVMNMKWIKYTELYQLGGGILITYLRKEIQQGAFSGTVTVVLVWDSIKNWHRWSTSQLSQSSVSRGSAWASNLPCPLGQSHF